ncbi:alpha/beta hydrolase [Vibrio profundum]|uniref:alpha/beta fold hydrolase n=1 Tax=Vibrio profundum TaxID=2910247 RepID=UPI003D0D2CDD
MKNSIHSTEQRTNMMTSKKNLNIYYELHGDPKSPPMVLISGLRADHTGWATITDELAKDYYVLVFDNRGTGQTTGDDTYFSVDTMAEDTITLMKQVGFESAFIVGHSMGGAIAQVIAHRYPRYTTSIVLMNTFIKLNNAAKAAFVKVEDHYEKGSSPAEIMDHIIPWVFSDSFITGEILALIRDASMQDTHPQTAMGYHRQMKALCDFNSSTWVSDVALPTLVIGSTNDITATEEESKQLHQRIRNSKLAILQGGHASTVEQPQELLTMLRAFCSIQQ